ncbi:hypothetical protein B0H13DRAFT_1850123 [Mycena leptocephala]|nr:hypothetical protein B0H13DRAFT_1850123 [Mycena leptocephala]
MSGAQMANASPAEIARGLITFLGEVSKEEGVKVLAALLSMQLTDADNIGISGEEILYHTSGTAIEDIRFRRPEGPRRGTATNPDRPGSSDTQDEVRVAEDLIVNPEWQRDQDLIDNLESELHQALSRIEEYEAQLQTMHKNWKKELERLRAERAERETELTTQKKKFEELIKKIQDLEAESANIRSHYQELQRQASESDTYTKQKDAELETVKSQYEDTTNECQRLKLELEKVQTNPNIHDELQRLRSENADYVKQLEENKTELDKVRTLNISLIGGLSPLFFLSFLRQTFEASTADLRFHQDGHWLHDDIMINLADNDRTKIWSGGGEGPADIVCQENLHFDAKWSECGPVHTVEITGEKLATPQGRFQLYRIFQTNVGALIVLARYGINKPDAYADIRGKDKRILGKVIQDTNRPKKSRFQQWPEMFKGTGKAESWGKTQQYTTLSMSPSGAMEASESMSQNSGKQLNNWPLLAGLSIRLSYFQAVLLLYDYLLTLPTEIQIVWPRPKPWFLLIRYLALSTNFTMVVLTFGTFRSQVDINSHSWLGSTANTMAPLLGSAWEAGNSILIAAVDVANILIYYFGDVNWLTHGKPFLAGSLAWLASALSAVLTARLILNMCKVVDTDGMAVGDVASEDADTVQWNDIDGTPMEHIRGHVRNRASRGYGNDLE